MATWGSHFRIAENLLVKYPNLNRKCFAIGNIGPDCGLPDKNWSAFTPPKETTHFAVSNMSDFFKVKTNKFALNDVKFYLKYLKGSNLISPLDDRSFFFGYFIHLITDNLWNYYIMKPLKDNYLTEFQKNSNFIWTVKRDWYDLDKLYLAENKDSLFWKDFLKAEYNEPFLDFLPLEGVQRQMEFIKEFYQISKEEYSRISGREYVYLDKKEMDNFITNSSNIILEVLSQILEQNFSFSEKTSVLDEIFEWN